MPPSLANGDFRVMAAIQRRGGDGSEFYLVLHNLNQPRHASGRLKLSCDCTQWTFNKRHQHPERTCRHTDMVDPLLQQPPQRLPGSRPANRSFLPQGEELFASNPVLSGIYGHYSVVERTAPIVEREGDEPYHWAHIAVTTADGGTASGLIGFAERHGLDQNAIRGQTTAWVGYQIAAELGRRSGAALPGIPPGRFQIDSDGRSRGRGRGQEQPIERAPVARRYGIGDMLTMAGRTDLGDGLTPRDRAEQLLATFLGGRYTRLQQQGYLDVSSKRSADVFRFVGERIGWSSLPRGWERMKIVYRVRLDPRRSSDRRIRVFWVDPDRGQHGYWHDFCVVRSDTSIPVQDAFVSIMLGLSSSEMRLLEVVGSGNIFDAHSDDHHREPAGPPPVWIDRTAAAPARAA